MCTGKSLINGMNLSISQGFFKASDLLLNTHNMSTIMFGDSDFSPKYIIFRNVWENIGTKKRNDGETQEKYSPRRGCRSR